jgi:hypothetical protein
MNGNPPNTEELATITTMAAAGVSQTKIAETLGRSRHLVKNALAEPEVQRAVKDEKAELSVMYRTKARAILESIDDDVIAKGNLLQRATSSAICLDKALILAGEAPINVNVQVLMQVVDAIRDKRDAGIDLLPQQARLSLPA